MSKCEYCGSKLVFEKTVSNDFIRVACFGFVKNERNKLVACDNHNFKPVRILNEKNTFKKKADQVQRKESTR